MALLSAIVHRMVNKHPFHSFAVDSTQYNIEERMMNLPLPTTEFRSIIAEATTFAATVYLSAFLAAENYRRGHDYINGK